jgi:hypothetical protein
MRTNTKLTGALAALAVVAAIAAPAAYAAGSVHPRSPVVRCDPSAGPPPPSSIAASAAKEYAILRACRRQADSTTFVSAPVARKPSAPTGFDWASAAIGAIAVAGVSLMSVAALGVRRRTRGAVNG